MIITPSQFQNPKIKPKWTCSVGVMESIVAYNCRKYGFPRPVLAAPMWEGAGNKTFDFSGHSHTVNLINCGWQADGILCDGTSSYGTNFTLCPSIDLSEPWTLCFDFYSNDMSKFVSAAGFYDFDGNEFVFLGHTETGVLKIGSAGKTPGTGQSLDQYQKHSGVLLWTGTKLESYIDGVFDYDITPASTILWSVLDTVLIGCEISGSGNQDYYWDGGISNVNIFNCKLVPAQIKSLHDDPYFMFRMPEELYGITSGGIAKSGTVAISENGLLTLDFVSGSAGNVLVSSNGSLVLNAVSNRSGIGVLSAEGDITLITANTRYGSALVSTNGDLIAVGTAESTAKTGSVLVSIGGTLTTVGDAVKRGSALVSVDGSLTIVGEAVKAGSILVSADGTLAVTGGATVIDKYGLVGISGDGLLVGTYSKNQFVEEVWLGSKLVQGVLGTSLLRRVGCGY